MARLGHRRFKKSRVRVFTEVRNGSVVRVTREQVKGQKLRDRAETVEVFEPVPALKHVPGVWVGRWRA